MGPKGKYFIKDVGPSQNISADANLELIKRGISKLNQDEESSKFSFKTKPSTKLIYTTAFLKSSKNIQLRVISIHNKKVTLYDSMITTYKYYTF